MDFFSCWNPMKLLLRVSADLDWDRDLFLCIASCPLNICDHWDLQAGKLSVWFDPTEIVLGFKCSHPTGMHVEGVIIVTQNVSWMQEL